MTRITVIGSLALALLTLGACTGGDVTARPSPTPADPRSGPTVQPSPPAEDRPLTVQWSGSFELDLPNGWVVQDCEGDRTHVCVHDDDAQLGDIELLAGYPLDDAQKQQDPPAVLDGLAEGFLAHFREDRRAGCPHFSFVADEVRRATVGGHPATRASFSLIDGDGRVVERVVNHFALVDDSYAIVNTDAYVDTGGCLGPSETDPSFSPVELAMLEEHLDRIVADSPLPAETTP